MRGRYSLEKKAFEIVENDQSQAEIVINGNSIGVIPSYDAVLIGSKLRVWMNANKREASIGYMVNNPFCSRVNVAKSFPSDMITTQIMICRCKYNSNDNLYGSCVHSSVGGANRFNILFVDCFTRGFG